MLNPSTKQKIALVTGGNSGIGRATAELLKKKGYNVYIAGRDEKKLQKVAEKNPDINWIKADMSKLEDIQKLAAHFSEAGLDVLVNNAGILQIMPLSHISTDMFTKSFSDVFNVNVLAPLLLIKELLEPLKKRQGCVTNLSSIGANYGAPAASIYGASKGSIEGFTKNLAIELAPFNVRVNAVAPGAVKTSIFKKAGIKLDQLAQEGESVEENIPLGRLGKPEEIAHVIVAQVESTYTTGAIWTVDGGSSALL